MTACLFSDLLNPAKVILYPGNKGLCLAEGLKTNVGSDFRASFRILTVTRPGSRDSVRTEGIRGNNCSLGGLSQEETKASGVFIIIVPQLQSNWTVAAIACTLDGYDR